MIHVHSFAIHRTGARGPAGRRGKYAGHITICRQNSQKPAERCKLVINAPIAQWIEHQTSNLQVAGSSPVGGACVCNRNAKEHAPKETATAGQNFNGEYQKIAQWQTRLYRDLHRNPELSLKEFRTAERIEAELSRLGTRPMRIGETGVAAVIRNGTGKTVLARADIDALPVTENTALPYASQIPGIMHACGHDMHICALLGAVKLLLSCRSDWSGTYIALFQPAEELAAGAEKMLADGLREKIPAPQIAFAQHVIVGPAGQITTVSGPALSAGDSIRIVIYGRGAHGSMPHTSVDTVLLASGIVTRLHSVVSREIQPGVFAVLTVGAINAGTKSNIIPDSAELLVNIRTYSTKVRDRIISAVERIVRGECAAAGAEREPEFTYYDHYPLTCNDKSANEIITEKFKAYFGPQSVTANGKGATASEDFSVIPDAYRIPYVYWFVGCTGEAQWNDALARGSVETDIPANHNPGFAPQITPTLQRATEAQAVAALAFLER